ncbi:MAG TPA: alpha/beta fold hydrolase [Burkholderiaceae bacterium]|nr:alpha/beta fold hydrolase [Burkholderiaceae bacterium]
MTLTDVLKATDRSLKLSTVRAGVRIGALVAPARTAEGIARRFFSTEKPSLQRMRFSVSEPTRQTLRAPDGEVMTYRWGDVPRDPTVVLVHGWNGWAQQMERFITPLRESGLAVLAFDHVAHGTSDGRRSSLPAMIRTVEHIFAELPNVVGVIAHSLGAAAVASVLASSRRELRAAVLIAPPSDPRPYLTMLARMLGAPQKLMLPIQQAAERIAGVEFKRLVADPWTVRRIRTPLMIVHDIGDDEVPISNGYAYTMGMQARMLATDGLGHRRILRDLHVVDEATGFIAQHQPVRDQQRSLIAA